MSESCGNPATETGEALMPSEPLNVMCIFHLVESVGMKKSANSTGQESASNVKLFLETW
jgi:hypothetical protein